jgi:hypothetical protein
MKFELSIGRITFDKSLFTAEAFAPEMQKEMEFVKADHEKLYEMGYAPDGSKQKEYSAAYQRQIKAGKVQGGKGGKKKRSLTPNLKISGEMRDSQQVTRKGNSIELAYSGEGAKKAAYTREMGFKHSFLSDRDQEKLTDAALDKIKRDLPHLIKIDKPK